MRNIRVFLAVSSVLVSLLTPINTRGDVTDTLIKEASARQLQLTALAWSFLSQEQQDQIPKKIERATFSIGPILPKELDRSSLATIQVITGGLMIAAAVGIAVSAEAQFKKVNNEVARVSRWVWPKMLAGVGSALGGVAFIGEGISSSGTDNRRYNRKPWFGLLQGEIQVTAWTTEREFIDEVSAAAIIVGNLESDPKKSAVFKNLLKEEFNEFLHGKYLEGGAFDVLKEMRELTDTMDELFIDPETMDAIEGVLEKTEEVAEKSDHRPSDKKITKEDLLREHLAAIEKLTSAFETVLLSPMGTRLNPIDKATIKSALRKAQILRAKVEIFSSSQEK